MRTWSTIMGIACCWALVLLGNGAAFAKFPATDVPTFTIRAHAASVNGQNPAGKQFSFSLGTNSSTVTGGEWTMGLAFTTKDAEVLLGPNSYPAMYMDGYPMVTGMRVNGVVDTTTIEGEMTLDERPNAPLEFSARLFGGRLGLLVWRRRTNHRTSPR